MLILTLLVVIVTWPLALTPNSALLGFSNIDAHDTVTLRGAVASLISGFPAALSDGVSPTLSRDLLHPIGFPILQLTPNLLDHLTAAPLALLLPFPLADNLWWMLALGACGWCAHRLGRRMGGEGGGWLAAVAFLTSEPLLREANLHHAPQAMLFWAPLYLEAVWVARERADLRTPALAGLWLALAAMSYWYLGMFLVLGTLPLLIVALGLRRTAVVGAVAAAVAAPLLLPQLLAWDERPLTARVRAPSLGAAVEAFSELDEGLRFKAWHGADPLFPWRPTPMDTSSRLSMVLVAAAIAGALRFPRAVALALAAIPALGAVMVLGPVLRWGETAVTVGGDPILLPFEYLGRLHPTLGRLTWPERWGVLLPIGLVALASRAPRPLLLAALVLVENAVFSANLPLQLTPLRGELCWRALSSASGAVIELPLRRAALRSGRVGIHQRLHGRPVVNPLSLPPGVMLPDAWRAWSRSQPLIAYLRAFEGGAWPPDPGAEAVRSIRAAGVSAVAVDVEPNRLLTDGGINRYRGGLSRHLGPPIDLGCALVWWLDSAPAPEGVDGEGFRAAEAAWQAENPSPQIDALIEPLWGPPNKRPGG